MKVTLYELFTLIKENKAPNKIKYNNREYEFDGEHYLTKDENGRVCLGGLINEINMLCIMFDECIEIIEESKKIEKIDLEVKIDKDVGCWKNINNLFLGMVTLNDKLDEIIDYINSKENNNE